MLVAVGVGVDPLIGGQLGIEGAQQLGERLDLGAVEGGGHVGGEPTAPGVGEGVR
ncbi:hypothetical protein ACF08M_13010 [Streptomyces sp. NPDC015032]|uniref:hypothetical protein n=1 Tax=Streptomyces sp. NPDC015032 TaxID=3364937 RepID=UPI0036FA544E